MKVLHVLDHSLPVFSGYSFRSSNIVQFQKALGIDPVVLTSTKQGTTSREREDINGVPYYRTNVTREFSLEELPFLKEVVLMLRVGRRLREVASRENIDLIHSHSPSLNGFPAWVVARRLGIPFVYEARAFWEDAAVDHGTFHVGSIRYRLSRSFEAFIFRRADSVVVIAEEMRKELVKRKISRERIAVVGNGVDLGRFRPRERSPEIVQRLELNGGPVFGFVGSFYRYEGLELLLQSFRSVREQIPNARLLIIGGGPAEKTIKDAARELEGAVSIIGHVPHSRVPDYYSVIDICVYPRRKMRLTELVTPLKPLEAMAMGKAVLASDVGGHRELIKNGRTGLLFRSDDVRSLTAGAVELAMNSDLRSRLSTEARQYVEAEREWQTLVSGYVDIYNRLLG